jgi:hypothetical protein
MILTLSFCSLEIALPEVTIIIKNCPYLRLSAEETLSTDMLPVLTPTVGSNVQDIAISKRKCIRLREVSSLQKCFNHESLVSLVIKPLSFYDPLETTENFNYGSTPATKISSLTKFSDFNPYVLESVYLKCNDWRSFIKSCNKFHVTTNV